MGKKKDFRPKKAASTSRMYPSLHENVANSVLEYIGATRFHDEDSDENCKRRYDTFVVGDFRCYNPKCRGNFWTSGKVTISIRRYAGNDYNAVVFGQRCEACEQLGKFKLDKETYIDRVSYWLKKWAGVQMELPPHTVKSTPRHRTELCEGCKRGVCKMRSK
ncbi:hypothetical protein J1614_010647 [Plenodomus biglobosus]|nr:hypothetical protein J1614_010647 [Plenodomus biglobosus]